MSEHSGKTIDVCICTFRRPAYLKALLQIFEEQERGPDFSFSLIIVDNDSEKSALPVIEQAKKDSSLAIEYFSEPDQNIAKARNKALLNSRGEYLAFIDDDEIPQNKWLMKSLTYLEENGADGVLGPVIPRFEEKPKDWVVKGNFYNRERMETGTALSWHQCRTGNVLIRSSLFREKGVYFREEFGRGGEDRDLFRRLIDKGCQFLWCDEAYVYERIPASRCSLRFMLKRALIRGANPRFGLKDYLKSLIAIPAYIVMLPLFLIGGKHLAASFLIRIFDHAGRILALLHISAVREKYLGG